MTVYIDINTGELRLSPLGPVSPGLALVQGDIFPLGVVLTDGSAIVTADMLPEAGSFELLLKLSLSNQNAYISFEADAVTAEGVALFDLDLSAKVISEFFSDKVPAARASTPLWTQLRAITENDVSRQTLHQSKGTLARDLNGFTKHTPETMRDNDGSAMNDNDGSAIKDV